MNRLISCLLLLLASGPLAAQPVAISPQNPHYLSYRGEPILLITSAEHYGALLNQAFDVRTYLQTLAEDGMNYTRIFTGSYVEIPGSFNIEHNTLSPAPGQYLTPWQRVAEAGLFEGEQKFDLTQWNPAYFERLHALMAEAERLGIIVEVTLFCATYQDASWERHPFNPANNVNNTGSLERQEFNSLRNPEVVKHQKALVRKLAKELNAYDNFFFEICNEPWADRTDRQLYLLKTLRPQNDPLGWALWASSGDEEALAWQEAMAQVIRDTEARLPKRHLIAQNYTNFKQALKEVTPTIDLINFHYAWPEAVHLNRGWGRPIGFDESGFAGTADSTYLDQAWAFMLAGGALFNNLDYSFFVGEEDGNGLNNAPGGGSPRLRQQLSFLQEFLSSLDFVRMQPDHEVIFHAPGRVGQALSEPGKQYALYFSGQGRPELQLQLPKGRYSYTLYDPDTGTTLASGALKGRKTPVRLPLPTDRHRLALKLLR